MGTAVDHQQHGAAVAIVVAGGQHVEAQVGHTAALLQALRHAVIADHIHARPQHPPSSLGLQLERGKTHHIGLRHKKRR